MKRYVALVGFMASGKSTIGRALARRLGCAFSDTDELVVRARGVPISHIFEREGEAAFRTHERRAVREAFSGNGGIVALGGGALCIEENRKLLAERAYGVFVKMSPQRIQTRLRRSREVRPLLGADPALETIAQLYERRLPQYAAMDCILEADGMSCAKAVEEIVAWLGGRQIAIGPR